MGNLLSKKRSYHAVNIEPTQNIRKRKIGVGVTVENFVRKHRSHKDETDCVFVPGAVEGSPAKVKFCGRTIAAARFMALLTHGTPKSEKMVVRHTCGNGHLSCVNPHHVVWGSQGDNIADANRHRKAERTGEQKTLV